MGTNLSTKIRDFFATSRTNKFIALIAMVAVGVTGFMLIRAGASYFAAVDPSQGAVSGNAQVVNDANALSGTAIQFMAPASTPPPTTVGCKAKPSGCGFPDATNTGVPTTQKTVTQPQADYTIDAPGYYPNIHVTGTLTINASNVTVQYAKIDCVNADTCVILGGSNDKLLDSEVGGGANGTTFTGTGIGLYSGGGLNTNNVVQRVNIHHTDDGLRIDGGTTISDSYIHNLSDGLNGSHSDGSQSCGGTYMNFIHNTIVGYNNDPIFLQGGDCGSNVASTLDHVVVDNNLLVNSGDSSYGISVGTAKNIQISHNRFDKGWQVTPIGVYLPKTLVLDLTSLTLASQNNWSSLGNIYDADGSPLAFPGN